MDTDSAPDPTPGTNKAVTPEQDNSLLEIVKTLEEDHQGVLKIEEFPWYPEFRSLSWTFRDEGQEVRIVGGAVRDIILEIQPKDIDLCTTASPDEMLEILDRRNIDHRETGIQHGTLTVRMNGCNFEMTSLRVDVLFKGEKICRYGRSFRDDANRRDLTVNAMSLDVEGRLFDYFNGRQHLKEGVLRFTDSALTRVCEDPLRILRYFRFSSCSQLFSTKCPDDYQRLPEDYQRIFSEKRSALADPSIVKGERIWKEFGKTLSSPRCCYALDQMKKCKILRSLGFPVLEGSFEDLIDPTVTTDGVVPETRAAVILGIIFKGRVDMLDKLVTRWRVSNKVKDVSRIAADITEKGDIREIKRQLYFFNPASFKEEKQVRIQALKTDKKCWLHLNQIKELEKFERPTFPFTKDHFAKVPKFKTKRKDAIDRLKEAWFESCFEMSVSEMVEMVRDMAENPDLLRKP